MATRRSLALTTAALALAATGLSSCGFDYATDRVYQPGVGVNNREGVVDVLSAVIVSSNQGSGTFLASLSNNSQDEAAQLVGLTGAQGVEVTATLSSPVDVPPAGLVNLAEPPANIGVTGDFQAGDFVPVSLEFDSGERADLEVPVVTDTGYYEGMDTAGSGSSGDATPSDTASTTPAE